MILIKITIDTKEDSHEEIKKVIRLLHHLVGEEKVEKVFSNSNIFEQPGTEVKQNAQENAFGSMFGSAETAQASEKPEDTPPKIEIVPY